MSYDSGDDEQVKTRKTKYQLRRETETEYLKQILATKGGRNFIWRLLETCGVFHSVSNSDAIPMAINSGRRDAGLWALVEVFAADPAAFIKMQTENSEEDTK